MPRGRNGVTGEQLAQVDNRDPFAVPVWRSPVYRTPEPVIMIVQLIRLICRVLWFALTHPGADAVAALVVVTWLGLSWPGVAGLAAVAITGLAGLRIIQPAWFARFVAVPVRDRWRWWFYRRRWKAAMTLAGLAPDYRGRPILSRSSARCTAPGAVTGCRSAWCPGSLPPTSPTGPRAWRTGSARTAVPSPRRAPGVVVLELVRATRSPTRSRRCRSPESRTWRGCRSAGARTARPWRLRLPSTACADRRGHRGGQGLGDLVADPRDAARASRPGWCRCWAWIRSGWSCRSAGRCSTGTAGTPPRHRRPARGRGRGHARPGRAVRRPDPHLHPHRPSSRSW